MSTPVIVGALIFSILLFGFLGWRFMSAPPRDAGGQDLSKAGIQPQSRSAGAKPRAAAGIKPRAGTKKTP